MLDDYLKIKLPEFNIHNTLFVARPGLPFIFAGTALVLIFWALDLHWVRNIFLAMLAFTVWFFRDPARETPPGTFGLAPADGRVIRLERKAVSPVSGKPALKVSIFMNVFSVHVNRMPLAGSVELQDYRPGALVNASLDKASEKNERNVMVISTPDGHRFEMVQIAGLVARRIVSWVNAGDEVSRGQRFGMIRFGSRVDLYLPQDAELMIALGQSVNAGWSPVWRWAEEAGGTPPPAAGSSGRADTPSGAEGPSDSAAETDGQAVPANADDRAAEADAAALEAAVSGSLSRDETDGPANADSPGGTVIPNGTGTRDDSGGTGTRDDSDGNGSPDGTDGPGRDW
ncbi:MAG: phosphatidylserine decarboxylase family protein [Deltaproteobacteria bacterium]|nr:phosphatidylserine decarboxylase family protein [Deltaproteobacteria bacterium]